MPTLPFSTRDDLLTWLAANHSTETELWVQIYKKDSGTPSVTWDDCVIAGLTWGWIDGQKKSLDELSFLQRMTPRRKGSGWSKRNCEHAERLMAEGLMQPPGRDQVEAAKADGRWDQAYAGSAELVIPEDFLAELANHPAAQRAFEALKRQQLFAIYYRLNNAKKPETRLKRLRNLVAQLNDTGTIV